MFSNKKNAVILLDRNCLYYYGGNVQNSILRLDFSPDIIRDLDVVNHEQFYNQIKSFIETNKLIPTNIAMVLSPYVIFEKDLQVLPTIDVATEMQNFIDSIPFDNLTVKKYPFEKYVRLVAVNKPFYDTIKQAFERRSFLVESITPYFSLKTTINFQTELTVQTMKFILNKSDVLKQENILLHEYSTVHEEEKKNNKEEDSEKKRTYILAGVFVILIIVLIVLLIQNIFSKPAETDTASLNQPPAVPISPTAVPVPTVPVSDNANATSSAKILESVIISIVNSSGIPGKAEELKTGIEKAGYRQVTTKTGEIVTGSRTSVLFSEDISQIDKNTIISQVKILYPEISTRVSKNLDADIVIVIVQPAEE
jgi:hypothetical protein